MKIGRFANFSERLKISGLNDDHTGMVMRKIGKDQSKTLSVGLFPPKISW